MDTLGRACMLEMLFPNKSKSIFICFVNIKKALLLELSLAAPRRIKMGPLPFIVQYSHELRVIIRTSSLGSCATFLPSSPSKLKKPGPSVFI